MGMRKNILALSMAVAASQAVAAQILPNGLYKSKVIEESFAKNKRKGPQSRRKFNVQKSLRR